MFLQRTSSTTHVTEKSSDQTEHWSRRDSLDLSMHSALATYLLLLARCGRIVSGMESADGVPANAQPSSSPPLSPPIDTATATMFYASILNMADGWEAFASLLPADESFFDSARHFTGTSAPPVAVALSSPPIPEFEMAIPSGSKPSTSAAVMTSNPAAIRPSEQCLPPYDFSHGLYCNARGSRNPRRGYYNVCGRILPPTKNPLAAAGLRNAALYTYSLASGDYIHRKSACPKKTLCQKVGSSRQPGQWFPEYGRPKPSVVCVPRDAIRPDPRSRGKRPVGRPRHGTKHAKVAPPQVQVQATDGSVRDIVVTPNDVVSPPAVQRAERPVWVPVAWRSSEARLGGESSRPP